MNVSFQLQEIVDRIERLCAENKIEVKNMLAECGLSRNVVDNMKNGSKPSADKIQAIASFFGVTIDYLMGISPVRHGSIELIDISDEEFVPIPIIGNVAAGYQALAETNIVGYELVSRSTINDGYDYAWLRVKGDSMSPLILEDDLILVRIQSEVDSGDLAVVTVDEEDGLIKRVKYSTNKVTLISENPEYPPRVFEKNEMNRLRIWGKAIDLKRRLF